MTNPFIGGGTPTPLYPSLGRGVYGWKYSNPASQEAYMRVNLDVPYADKDEAKELGAKWCAHYKTWYAIHDGVEKMMRFIKWIPDGVIPDYDPHDEKNFWHEMRTSHREQKKRWRYLEKKREEERQMKKAEEYERKISEQEA